MNRARALWPVLAVALTIGLGGCSASPTAQAAPSSAAASASAATDPSPASPSASAAPSPGAAPSTSAPAVALPLKMGSSGPAVTQLQQRLTALGYWLGPADGRFGGLTQQAVFALQKAAGQRRTGTVTATTLNALDAGTRPVARSRSGRVIEVNLGRNLLLFVNNGHVEYTLNTSTGGGYVYYDQGERNVATTPKGHFRTYRVIDGPRISSLGLLIRPRYFTGGYAIHGAPSVPAYPASHGCVRVTNAAIDWIWSANLDPIGTTVWIY